MWVQTWDEAKKRSECFQLTLRGNGFRCSPRISVASMKNYLTPTRYHVAFLAVSTVIKLGIISSSKPRDENVKFNISTNRIWQSND